MRTNILEYLEEQETKRPLKKAFFDGDDSYTFSEFSHAARSVGSALLKEGTKKPVLILMDKSIRQLIVAFGAVYSNNPYVILDPDMPVKRMEDVIKRTNPDVLITDGTKDDIKDKLSFEKKHLPYSQAVGFKEDTQGLRQVRLRSFDTDPVYICFTSGSTGAPKGVCVNHRSIIDYMEHLSLVMGFSDESIFGNQTPFHVDASMKEVYGSVFNGGEVHIIPKEHFLMPSGVLDFLNEHKINTICWVASALSLVSSLGGLESNPPRYLHTISSGSEVFPTKHYNAWRTVLPNARFFNLYGPTEGTGVCCYHEIKGLLDENDKIPIGRPFKNAKVFLLDENGKIPSKGKEGEIIIGGTGVTMGYYGEAKKTQKSFTQNPLHDDYIDIVYHTGDIAYEDFDGNLVFSSRKDHQIKHMGHRIELG